MFQSLGLGWASPQKVLELGDREPPADESVDLTLPKVRRVGRALRRRGGGSWPSSGGVSEPHTIHMP